tara:strand:+ start:859 stop:1038 length:180 start_codon:yes stop_codon:yes gene_type:complete
LNEELNMYGDPKKPCCVKNCNVKADLVENGHHYCCEHYSIKILGKTLEQIEKELQRETN